MSRVSSPSFENVTLVVETSLFFKCTPEVYLERGNHARKLFDTILE